METKLYNTHLKVMSKLGLLIILAFSLSACLEVKDDSNDDVVSLLNAQNAILQAQLEQQKAAQAAIADAAPIILMGTVYNVVKNTPAAAKLTLNIGDAKREPVTSSDGSFEFEQVPADSNYELIVESTDNTFISRAFYGTTRAATGSNKVFQDLGLMNVSPGKTYSFKVTNDKTNSAVESLVFRGRSDSGSSSRKVLRPPHQSTYDKETKTYSIVLPSEFTVLLEADIDLNGDGVGDFTVPSPAAVSGVWLRFFSTIITTNLDIQLEPSDGDDGPLTREYEFRFTVLDDNLDTLSDVVVTVDDVLNGERTASFDEASAQYVLNAKVRVNGRLDVVIPAFSVGETEYQSSAATFFLTEREDELLRLSVSLSNTAENTNTFYRLDGGASRVDIVMPLRELQITSVLELVFRSRTVSAPKYIFKAFYSSAIALLEDSTALIQKEVIAVVKGNASPDDAVLPGSTLISKSDVNLGANSELKAANTTLTLTPKNTLAVDFSYRYEVGTVKDTLADVERNLFGDDLGFSVPLATEFDIDQLVLDNENWTTNGVIITATNTAGIASTIMNGHRGAYLYFPRSISNLKSMIMTKTAVRNGTSTSVRNNTYRVVTDGRIRSSAVYAVALASNENILSAGSFSHETGTTLEDGRYYYFGVGESGSDHTSGRIFQVDFFYVYETKSGETKSGNITLDVK